MPLKAMTETDMAELVKSAIIKSLEHKDVSRAIEEITDRIHNSISRDLKDQIEDHIYAEVRKRTADLIEGLLTGDEKAAKSAFGLWYNARYMIRAPTNIRLVSPTGGFEPNCVGLRRKIVEVNRDVLGAEYAKDLEAKLQKTEEALAKALAKVMGAG